MITMTSTDEDRNPFGTNTRTVAPYERDSKPFARWETEPSRYGFTVHRLYRARRDGEDLVLHDETWVASHPYSAEGGGSALYTIHEAAAKWPKHVEVLVVKSQHVPS